MAYLIGESVSGTVNGVTDYGAFVRLADGNIGMIHISKLSDSFVSDIHSVIKVGDKVEATVISADEKKIALSLIGVPKRTECARPIKQNRPVDDFESMLQSFKLESDKKLASISRGRINNRKKRK